MNTIFKSFHILIVAFISFITLSCGDRGPFNEIFGGDKNYKIPSNSKFNLHQMDTLKYVSQTDTEMYYISHLIEGKYYEGTTGTCGKEPFDIFDFQAIYIRSVDSTDGHFYAYSEMDDCSGRPSSSDQYICIIKNVVNTYYSIGISYDASLSWLNEFEALESKYDEFLTSINLNGRVYKNIYVYSSSINKSSRLQKLYYSKNIGFIGYLLKNNKTYNLINHI